MGVPESLCPGDMIEFHRHFGIYEGYRDGIHWVIHLTSDQTSWLRREKAIIKEDDYFGVLDKFTDVKVNTFDNWLRPLPTNQILERAKRQLGKKDYNLFTENYKHFAIWCRYGLHGSSQVENVRRLICGRKGGTPSREVIEANEKLLQELEEGDLVEFPRVGYSHWAVYVGNGKVVHLTSDDGDAVDDDELDIPDPYDDLAKKATRKAAVQEADLLEVAGNSKAKKNNSKHSRFPPLPKEIIVKNAKDKLGKTGYHVVVQNCEHFASWCRYGVAVSDQVEFLSSLLWRVFMGSANV